MTKKEFIEQCNFHVYTGYLNGHKIKHNVIFFDYKDNDEGRGYKYAVAMDIKNGTKAKLIDYLYDWVREKTLPYYVRYKFAATDAERFRPQLQLNW